MIVHFCRALIKPGEIIKKFCLIAKVVHNLWHKMMIVQSHQWTDYFTILLLIRSWNSMCTNTFLIMMMIFEESLLLSMTAYYILTFCLKSNLVLQCTEQINFSKSKIYATIMNLTFWFGCRIMVANAIPNIQIYPIKHFEQA